MKYLPAKIANDFCNDYLMKQFRNLEEIKIKGR